MSLSTLSMTAAGLSTYESSGSRARTALRTAVAECPEASRRRGQGVEEEHDELLIGKNWLILVVFYRHSF